jgi:hypothetical protein
MIAGLVAQKLRGHQLHRIGEAQGKGLVVSVRFGAGLLEDWLEGVVPVGVDSSAPLKAILTLLAFHSAPTTGTLPLLGLLSALVKGLFLSLGCLAAQPKATLPLVAAYPGRAEATFRQRVWCYTWLIENK